MAAPCTSIVDFLDLLMHSIQLGQNFSNSTRATIHTSDVIEIACGNQADVLLKRTSVEAIGKL